MKNRSVILTAIVAALSCGSAAAITFGAHLGSVHLPAREGQSNINPGIYVRTDDGWTAGAYRNTLGRPSVYAGYTLTYGPAALTIAATTGYQLDAAGRGAGRGYLAPMIAPSIALPALAGITPRLALIPRAGGMRSTVLHLTAERRF